MLYSIDIDNTHYMPLQLYNIIISILVDEAIIIVIIITRSTLGICDKDYNLNYYNNPNNVYHYVYHHTSVHYHSIIIIRT